MTVAELITLLQTYPPHMQVFVNNAREECCDIEPYEYGNSQPHVQNFLVLEPKE